MREHAAAEIGWEREVKVRIYEDEKFPVYSLIEGGSTQTTQASEVSEETLARWRSVLDAHEAVQNEMHEHYVEACKALMKCRR